jgi:hypothetical protein
MKRNLAVLFGLLHVNLWSLSKWFHHQVLCVNYPFLFFLFFHVNIDFEISAILQGYRDYRLLFWPVLGLSRLPTPQVVSRPGLLRKLALL